MPLQTSGTPSRRPAPSPYRCAALLAAMFAVPAALVPGARAQGAHPTGATRPAADPRGPEAAYDAARSLADGGLVGPAARAFADFRAAFPRAVRAPEALVGQAEATLAAQDDDGAADLYARFEAEYPAHPLAPGARLALGRYYVDTGDDARAEGALAAALERPGPPAQEAEAAYLLGVVARRQGRPDAAAAAFARAGALDAPLAPAALYALGATRVETGDWAGAADAFEALAARAPGSAEDAAVRLALAEAYVRTGRLPEALAEAERRRPLLSGDDAERADLLVGETRLRTGDAAGALAPLAAVPDGSPYARRARLALGRAHYARGAWREAVGALATARTDADGREATDALAREAAYVEGLALRRLGQLGAAETRLAAAAAPDSPLSDAGLLELGVLHYERRRLPQAAEAFERLLREHPRSPLAGEAARMLGETYAAGGDARRAAEAFRRAESLGTATADTRAEVAFQEAYALVRAGRYDDGTDALLAVARQDPAGPRAGEALFWAGEAAFQAGRYARAEEILADFGRRFPAHRQADAGRYVLAWTFFRRRDYAGAAAGFERFLAAYTPSEESVPYVADALLRLGDSYYALRRFDDARAAYARVPAATPTRAGADYALFQTAQAFAGQGQTANAIDTYARLVADFPASDLAAEALVARSALLSASARYDEAVADAERAAALRADGPAAPRALIAAGDARLQQGRARDAEAFYRRALDRYPGSPAAADALDGLGAALDAQGRQAEFDAAADAVEARVTDPSARARIRLGRAQSDLAAGNTAAALARLEALVGSGPPAEIDAEARLALAGALLESGRAPEAARALRALLARDAAGPLAPEAQLLLADALLAANDAGGALAAAQEFARRYPDDAERLAAALRREADALAALGRPADADAALRRLVGSYPTSAAAAAVRAERPDLAPRR